MDTHHTDCLVDNCRDRMDGLVDVDLEHLVLVGNLASDVDLVDLVSQVLVGLAFFVVELNSVVVEQRTTVDHRVVYCA